jgi:hypothetical protein
MDKVYIVMRGEYSNTWIDKVFSDKHKAEKYVNLSDSEKCGSPYIIEKKLNDNEEIKDIPYVEASYLSDLRGENRKAIVTLKHDNSTNDENILNNQNNNFIILCEDCFDLRFIIPILQNNFDEDKIVKKYETILHDMISQINYYRSNGWEDEMIEEWFNTTINS